MTKSKILSGIISMALSMNFAVSGGLSDVFAVDVNDGEVNSEETDFQYDLNTGEHAYDPIAEMEAEQEYRESARIIENRVIFSVLDYRENGDDASYLTSESPLCKVVGLTDVSVIIETKSETAEPHEGQTAYEVFYEAATSTDDIWGLVDKLKEVPFVVNAEPDFIWDKTAVGGYDVASEDFARSTHFPCLDVENVWEWLWGNNNHIPPGNGVVVAVIDTGVDYTHADLKDSMWKNTGEIAGNGKDDDGNGFVDDVYGYDFVEKDGNPMDDQGHGTHVAGIIGMSPKNGGGVGLAYGAKIMAIKAGQSTGSFASSDIAKAVKYAADNGADVINMSFGGTGKSSLVEEALKDASHDCVLVASAGNDGASASVSQVYPAGYNYVIGTMATDNTGTIAEFSNWDDDIGKGCEYEMAAPGVSIYSTLPGNRYAYWSGTSMAAPTVAATAAILRSKYTDKNKYTSRFITGQLVSATKDVSKGQVYPLLNIKDSLTNLPKPNIKLNDFYMFDDSSISSNNNGDGIAQPGETINLGFDVFNYWGKAKDVTVTVDAKSEGGVQNPYVEFVTNSVNIGEIGTFTTSNNGLSYTNGALTGVTKPIKLKIKAGTPNDAQIKLNFTVTAKNGTDSKDTTVYKATSTYTLTVQNGYAISGVIDHDMTWTADKYWIIQNNILIPEGVTVTVEPGTQIQFWSADPANPYAAQQDVYIQVEGRFIAEGTEDKPIEMFQEKGYEDMPVIISGANGSSSDASLSIIDSDFENAYTLLKYVNIVNAVGDRDIDNTSGGTGFSATFIDHCHFVNNINDDAIPIKAIFSKEISNSIFKNYRSSNDGNPTYYTRIGSEKIESSLFTDSTLYLSSYEWTFDSMEEKNIRNCVILNYYNKRENEYAYLYSNKKSKFINNAILPKYGFYKGSKLRFIGVAKGHNNYDISKNYWGTEDPQLVKISCYDADWNVSLNQLVQEPFLTLEDDMSAIYPFVTEAYLTDKDGNRIDTVNGKQPVSLHVKFNRDMAQDIQPQVTYGGSAPYTDYSPNGKWVGKREWRADFVIDPDIEIGKMYIRTKGGAAADDRWLVTGEDTERFFFNITGTGAQAMKLQGKGTSGSCDLEWVQDDYDTFAGYNLYRAGSYDSKKELSEQGFAKVNTSVLSDIKYVDNDVEQGKDYYYYFTVIDTAMNESKPSNVVKCTPLDNEPPVITHTLVKDAAVGSQIVIKADVQDNIKVDSVALYYRYSGGKEWKNVNMRNISDNNYSGIISAYEVTAEGSLEYYISASDGITTATSGSAKSPNKIKVSADHNFDEGTVKKAPTCTEAGETLYTCLDCGLTKTVEVPALGHDFSSEWTIDTEATCQAEGEKSHHCSRCDERKDVTVIPKSDHVWDAGKITKSNSCTVDGTKHHKCIYCDAEKDAVVPATGHDYEKKLHKSTCTERGYTENICKNCGESYRSDFTELAKHEYEENIVNEATCTTDGVKKLVCKRCGDTKSSAIPATGHHFTEKTVEASETALGYTLHTCDKCGYSYIDSYTEFTPETPLERTPGDVNEDGLVDLVDVILIRRFLAGGWDVTINESNADVDADGEVTLADVILIRRFLAGGFDVVLK